MTRQRLYVVYGKGEDAVGLVGSITTPISQAGGNIVDLRQDVLHGLFNILLVVDLAETDIRIEDFARTIDKISEDTGLALSVEKYNPTPRDPEKTNVLLILVGHDRTGVLSSISETLGKYNANIEFAQSIGREGIFLTELLTDISQCSIPLDNLQSTVGRAMNDLGIQTVFQTDDVFNKKRRMLLFEIGSSFISKELRAEILQQTGLAEKDSQSEIADTAVPELLLQAARQLEGVPVEVLQKVVHDIRPTPGTLELLQTLRTMGYKIALASNGFTLFTEAMIARLGIDYAYGFPLPVDDDSKCVAGDILPHELAQLDLEQWVEEITQAEGIDRSDVTVIADQETDQPLGIHVDFNLSQILDYYNRKILSRDALIGLLGSFGVPRTSS